MASMPGHPLLLRFIEHGKSLLQSQSNDTALDVVAVMGPMALSHVLAEYVSDNNARVTTNVSDYVDYQAAPGFNDVPMLHLTPPTSGFQACNW
jgi:hypothetical protein